MLEQRDERDECGEGTDGEIARQHLVYAYMFAQREREARMEGAREGASETWCMPTASTTTSRIFDRSSCVKMTTVCPWTVMRTTLRNCPMQLANLRDPIRTVQSNTGETVFMHRMNT